MGQQAYDDSTPEDRVHFMRCGTCGEWFDRRSLDELLMHETDHRPRADVQYSGSRAVTIKGDTKGGE